MGKQKPPWKGTLISRDFLKEEAKAMMLRCAKGGKTEHEVNAFVMRVERYLIGELLLNTREVMGGIKDNLDEAMEHLEKLAGGISEEQIQERMRQLGEGLAE